MIRIVQRNPHCFAIVNERGYSLNSRKTVRGAVALAQRQYRNEVIQVFAPRSDGSLELVETFQPAGAI